MDFNLLIAVIVILGSLVNIIIHLNDSVKRICEIKNKEIENQKNEFLMKVDPHIIDKEIDDFISNYINRYVIRVFLINNIDYIKKDQVDLMVRTIIKEVAVDMSELYISYAKLLVSIKNDDDLIKFINRRVSDKVLEFVTEFNKPK